VRYVGAVDFVFQWVTTYGYEALFLLLMAGIVGIPVPDETLLVFSGYLISRGTFHAAPAAAVAVCGSWCGISISYWIGRTLGLGVVHKFGRFMHVSDAQLQKVHQWFDQRGHWALFFGYYIAGVRHLTAMVAGASGVGFGSFMAYAWTGGFCWATAFLTLGYYIGADWKRIAELVHRDLLIVSIVVLIVAAGYGLIRWKNRRI
jgi:membrane protein DedA with SNARE-associated domain